MTTINTVLEKLIVSAVRLILLYLYKHFNCMTTQDHKLECKYDTTASSITCPIR